MSLDPRQHVFAWRRMTMFLLHVRDQHAREQVGVSAREGLLAPRAPDY
ncbi:hypothetical protein [Phycicoccus sp. Root101]|nr:hypothetical protein [Phycicoccus sp. Root101]